MPVAEENATRRVRMVFRTLIAAALLGVAYLLLARTQYVRIREAWAAHLLARPWTSTGQWHDIVVVGLGGSHPKGFRITAECTASLMMVPPILVLAVCIVRPAINGTRAVLAALAALAVVLAFNQVRILLIIAGWLWGGESWMWFFHVIFGTAISVAALLVAVVVQLRMCSPDWRRPSREQSAE